VNYVYFNSSGAATTSADGFPSASNQDYTNAAAGIFYFQIALSASSVNATDSQKILIDNYVKYERYATIYAYIISLIPIT
jgi:hypothetical protein